MKFTNAIILGSLAAGAVAERGAHRGRHARFHEKKEAAPSEADIANVIRSDRTLAKRCGEPIYAKMPDGTPFSFPNCMGDCASAAGCSAGGGSTPAPQNPPAAAPSPAAPAATPAADTTPEAQQHNQHTQKPKTSAAPQPTQSSSGSGSGSGSSGSGSGSSGSSSGNSASGGKKGLSYNVASLISGKWLTGGVSWAYNWASTSDKLPSGVQFVPMLHDLGSVGSFPGDAAKVDKSTPLLSFNEPDMSPGVGGSQIDAATAASKHKSIMGPLQKAGHPIGSPAVSSSNADNQGLKWLASFASSCGGDCPIDFCPMHWYGWNAPASQQADQFKTYMQSAISACKQHWPGKPIWVTEFAASGPNGGIKDPNVNADFLKIVVPWMDSQADIQRYSPFMVGDGDALGGSTPSAAGLALLSG